MVGSPSVHSTVETANHGGGKGHPLCGCMGLLYGQKRARECNFLIAEHRGKPYALIAHVRFE
jgi:hypothetical protein